MMQFEMLRFDADGLIPAIIQDYETGEVLMLAYMNEESLALTKETGFTWFYSRSRQELWNKGATSGNTQEVMNISYDCDGDTLIIRVKQKGAACHTGERSCFHNELFSVGNSAAEKSVGQKDGVNLGKTLSNLYGVIVERKANPKEGSYTNYLFDKGLDKILKKVGEESAETIIAAKNSDINELIYEASDLLYHLTVLLVQKNVTYDDIAGELAKRSLQK